jgi:hypothetical protein
MLLGQCIDLKFTPDMDWFISLKTNYLIQIPSSGSRGQTSFLNPDFQL